jgi:hypothetical protein
LKIGNIYHIDYSVIPNDLKSRPTHFTTIFKSNPLKEADRPLLKKTVAIYPGVDRVETKSFVQQYWMYLLPVALFLLFSPPPPEAKKTKRD